MYAHLVIEFKVDNMRNRYQSPLMATYSENPNSR